MTQISAHLCQKLWLNSGVIDFMFSVEDFDFKSSETKLIIESKQMWERGKSKWKQADVEEQRL